MNLRLIAAVCVLTLGACGDRDAETAQSQFPVINAPNYDSSIGPGGAAGIDSALAMTLDAVRAAAPNYVVAEVQDQVEGEAFTAITLSAGDEEVFRIYPTADRRHVHAIVTRSTQARGPLQEIVGSTLFGAAPAEEVPFCLAELIQGAPGFACSTAADGRFWRVYRLPAGAEAVDAFEEIDPDLLHDATLVEMRWIAPRAS